MIIDLNDTDYNIHSSINVGFTSSGQFYLPQKRWNDFCKTSHNALKIKNIHVHRILVPTASENVKWHFYS